MEPVLGIGLALFLQPLLPDKAGLVFLRGVGRVGSSGRKASKGTEGLGLAGEKKAPAE